MDSDKHARYRNLNRDKTRVATAAWYENNRDDVLRRRREQYRENRELLCEKRRERYQANRETILEKLRSQKTECPHCHLMYTSWYLEKHLETRHKIFSE